MEGKKEQGKRRKKHTSLFSFNHNRHGLQAKRKRGTISRETELKANDASWFFRGWQSNPNRMCVCVHGQLALEWGKNDMGSIARLLHHLDRLQSRRDHQDTRARQRYRFNRAMERIRQRVCHLVDDCHHRLAKFLCESYDHILIPLFETSKMSRKTTRKIRSQTVRSMLTWSHFRFRTLLIAKAREYPWVKVHVVTEEYTSKTCTGCGHVKNNLGGAKVYHCSGCQGRWDRDIAGARNIYLKNSRALGLCPGACCALAPSGGAAMLVPDAGSGLGQSGQ